MIKKLLLIYLALFLVACSDGSQVAVVDIDDAVQVNNTSITNPGITETDTYFFGFDLRSSPQEDAKQYLPFLKYLQDETGLRFGLKFTAKGHTVTDDLADGTIHFAAIGAGTYIKVDETKRPVSLVRGKNSSGKAEYQAFIVVSPGSEIKTLGELENRVFAFGRSNSTQGHIIPRIVLSKVGIKLDDFTKYFYTVSHHECANTVISGKADACGMQDTMAKAMAEQNLVRILHKSEYFPSSGIVAGQHVQVDVRNKVKQALVDFDPEGKHKSLLYNWHKTEMPKGFVPSSDADYKSLRNWANKLGLLEK